MDKVVSIPITYSKRKKNEMGKGYVPCEISSRYLMVREVSKISDKQLIMFDVMTENEGKTSKICEMSISLEDFKEAVGEMIGNK